MRTQRFKFLKFNARLIFSLFLLGLVFSACTPNPYESEVIDDRMKPETYMIGPEGATINAQNNEIFISIPEGAVIAPTELIVSFKKNGKNGSYILMGKTYSLKIVDQQLQKPVTLRFKYCLDELGCQYEEQRIHMPQRIHIFAYRNDYSGQTIESDCFSYVGDCCVDTDNKTVQACFVELGNFVVGIKR